MYHLKRIDHAQASPFYGFLQRFVLLLAFACLLVNPCHASQAGAEMNEADRVLNATYQKLLAKIPDAEDRSLLIAAQREWVKYRDAEVALHAHLFPEGKGGLFRKTDLTNERTTFLKRLLAETADPDRNR